ncbi:MAG: SPOR domain-containing protein [Nodosilinea sp.]
MPNQPLGLSSGAVPRRAAVTPSPLIQQALEGLMVNLDDELLRYRQNRSSQSLAQGVTAPLKFRPAPAARKRLDLITLKAPANRGPASQSQTPASLPPQLTAGGPMVAPPPPPNPRLLALLGQQAVPTTQAYGPQGAASQGHGYPSAALAPYQAIPDDYLESTEALLGSVPGSQVSAPAAYADSNYPADDYDYGEADYRPSLARQLTTPLGIGAILLLLVSSAGFGYLVTSPQTARHLWAPIAERWQQPDPAPEDPASATAQSADQPVTGLQGLGPDLSEQEFSSLDLDRISTLPSDTPSVASQTRPDQTELRPSPQSPDQATPPDRAGVSSTAPKIEAEIVSAPQAPRRPQPATVAAPAATPSPPTAAAPAITPLAPPPRVAPPAANARPPQPLAATPAAPPPAAAVPPGPIYRPAPTSSAPTPPASIPQAPAAPSYFVVADYTGAPSLESARRVVGDAYVTGSRIQLGAFSQESSAQGLVQQLQQQGIPARVASP